MTDLSLFITRAAAAARRRGAGAGAGGMPSDRGFTTSLSSSVTQEDLLFKASKTDQCEYLSVDYLATTGGGCYSRRAAQAAGVARHSPTTRINRRSNRIISYMYINYLINFEYRCGILQEMQRLNQQIDFTIQVPQFNIFFCSWRYLIEMGEEGSAICQLM